MLIAGLPPESLTVTKLRNAAPEPDEGAEAPDAAQSRWSATEMLLAAVIDELRATRWVYTQANSAKGKKVKAPEMVRRPGSAPRGRSRRNQMSLKDAMRIDPRLRLTAAKSRRMTAEDLAPYVGALADSKGRLSVTRAMREMHTGRDKAAEAIRIAREGTTTPR